MERNSLPGLCSFFFPFFLCSITSAQDVVQVGSTTQLIRALENQAVTIIEVVGDIYGNDVTAWNGHDLFSIERDVLIRGHGNMKILDFGYVPRRARLVAGKTLTFKNLEVQGVMDSLDQRVLWLTQTTGAYVQYVDSHKQQAGCQDLPLEVTIMGSQPRAAVPGQPFTESQMVSLGPRSLPSRSDGHPIVYPGWVLLKDLATPVHPSSDPSSNYVVWYRNTSMVCSKIADPQCLSSKGVRGCLTSLMAQDRQANHQKQLDKLEEAGSHEASNKTIILASVIPVLGVLLLASIIIWKLRACCKRKARFHPPGFPYERSGGDSAPPGILLGRLIGSGGYGRVYEGIWREQKVAVKIILSHGDKALAAITSEAKLSMSFAHKNVVRCLYYFNSVKLTDELMKPPTGTVSAEGTSLGTPGTSHTAGSSKFQTGQSQLPYDDITFNVADLTMSRGKHSLSKPPSTPGSWGDSQTPKQGQQVINRTGDRPGMAMFNLDSTAFQHGLSNPFVSASPATLLAPVPAVTMETWMVLELCDLGSLSRAIAGGMFSRPGGQGVNLMSVLLRARDIARGMAYLHSLNVCHGDLKPENVLLVRDSQDPLGCCAKVGDFGISRALTEGRTHLSTQTVGTVTHMSPELLAKGRLGPQVDVYSFGIIMWELVSGRPTYPGMSAGEVIHHVVVERQRPCFNDMDIAAVPHDYQRLAETCWQESPEMRPTFHEVVQQLDVILSQEMTHQP